MKKGWETKPLGDVFETVTGNTPSKSNAAYYGRHIPLVKPPELQDCEVSEAEDGLSEEGARVARVAPPSSILVSCIGNLGKIGFNTVPVAFNQQINAIIPDRSHAIPEFLFYQVLSCRFRDQLESLASGTTVSIVNKSRFNSIEIVLPPLAEQQRIVGVLDEAFAGLATAQAHAAQNLQNARALFESHLQSVFTHRGKGWVEKKLGDVCEFVGGSQPPKAVFSKTKTPDSIRLIQIRDYKSDNHVVYIPKAQARRFCTADDVMIGRYGPPIFQILRGLEGAYNVALMKAVPDEAQVNREFLFYFLKHPAILEYVIYHSERAAGQIGVTKETLAPYPIALPSLSEQAEVAANIDALAAETQRLTRLYEQKQAALAALKKSLLHQAFTGEL
jgi:type I restriction enzyme, S subunit